MVPSSSKSMAATDNHRNTHYRRTSPALAVSLLLRFLTFQKGHKISFATVDVPYHLIPYLKQAFDGLQQPLTKFLERCKPHWATVDVPYHLIPYLKQAFDGLQPPLTKFLERCKPHWVIYDFAPYWLPPICSELGIPCIYFSTFSASAVYYVLLDHYTSKARVSAQKGFPDEHYETKANLTVSSSPQSLPTKELANQKANRTHRWPFLFLHCHTTQRTHQQWYEEDATHSPTCPRQPRTCLPLHRTRLLLHKCLLLLHNVCHRRFLKNLVRARHRG
ncbi:UDP-glucuronosyl/UDP-glucosyltransferase [Vigna unguiculata]|uniref:UDP-glucuronosyl/UDP-glucosyltransferase n=1 Tax=Vigna unguiculata TaxID=3917 RepID=A0A4D6MLL3_VIGUN|nr:UDP-glucuronosyl/UDP-glucosyltransferase [Vigna unguiculata]